MTRHELKDGKWYLIRREYGFKIGKYSSKYPQLFSFDDIKLFDIKNVPNEMEWVEIDPELVFELFKDTEKWLPLISGVSSCARGPVE